MAYVFSGSPVSISDLDTAVGWEAPGSQADLRDIVQQLQGLRMSMAAGGSASALLEVQGSGAASKTAKLTQSDTIVGVLLTQGRGSVSGITSFRIPGNARVAVTDNYLSISTATAGEQVVVFWMDKTGYSAY